MPSLKFNPDGTKHIHEYIRRDAGLKRNGKKSEVFRCAHPLCSHNRNKIDLIGKLTICSLCHRNEFVLTNKDLQLAFPRCEFCSNRKEAKQKRHMATVLKGIFGE